MAEVTLGGGFILDIASGAEVADGNDRLAQLLAATSAGRPLHRKLSATKAAVATQTVIGLGHPPVGRVWNLVYLTVAGSDDRTVVAGATVASYTGNPNVGTTPALDGLIDPASGTQVPNSASWNKDQIWVEQPDHLVVVIYGAPVGQQLTATARVLDYAVGDREALNTGG